MGLSMWGSGLDYMRARYYTPGAGRFLNQDPIGQAGGLNVYNYTANNPVSLIDPKGNIGILAWAGLGALANLGFYFYKEYQKYQTCPQNRPSNWGEWANQIQQWVAGSTGAIAGGFIAGALHLPMKAATYGLGWSAKIAGGLALAFQANLIEFGIKDLLGDIEESDNIFLKTLKPLNLLNSSLPYILDKETTCSRQINDYVNKIYDLKQAAERTISPLVLDLDNDGIELYSLQNSQIFFDLDADGLAEKTGWVKPDDGLLAIDRNNNGRIDDITELFGNATTDGFIILKQLDSNNDKVIDNRDAQFANLRIWKDQDSDGFTDLGELRTLAAWNIRSIDLNYQATNLINEGNRVSSVSSYTLVNGKKQQIVDVWFALSQINTIYASDFNLKAETLFLPTLRGYGELPDLFISMSKDPILLGMMRNFVQFSTTNYSQFHAQVVNQLEALLYRWGGVEAIAVNSRGVNIDGRKLTFLEKLTGERFNQIGWGANPGPQASKKLRGIWNDLMREMLGRVLVQGSMRSLFPETSFNLNKDTLESPSTISSFLSNLLINAPTDPNQKTFYWNLAIVALDSFEDRFNLSQEQYDAQLNQTLTLAGFTGGVNLLRQPEFVQSFAGNIFGTANNDVLTGTSGNDRIYGGAGNDAIMGNAGNDVLDGGLGDDKVSGGDGDDVIKVGLGLDTLDGGNGNDTLELNLSNITTNLVINDLLSNANIPGVFSAINFEAIKLTTGSGNDVITQSSIVNGSVYRSDDELNGGSGNDTFNPGLGFSDEANGGEGNDTLILDYSIGDTGEFMQFELTKSNLTGISGSAGRTVTGASSWLDSIVFSGIDRFNVTGTRNNDRITTWIGDDLIIGGKGNDTLDGGAGSDTYRYQLGDGDDIINDSVFQNDGSIDRLVLSGTGFIAANIIINRVGTTDDLKITFKNTLGSIVLKNQLSENYSYGIETLTLGDNTIWNESQIWGAYLTLGADSNDTLLGTSDNDLIVGGKGDDVMTGRLGADRFLFDSNRAFALADLGVDRITDFLTGTDKIVLDKTTFTALTSAAGGPIASTEFATINDAVNGATSAGASAGRVVFNRANGDLFYNANGSMSGFGTGGRFAALSGVNALTASDLLLQA